MTQKIAILGCGKVAHLHARAISEIPGAELAGVWSRTPQTAVEFAENYRTEAFESIDSLIKTKGIDLAIISTPHPFHRHPAVEAAKAGAHILVEKPLASSLQDSDKIIEICRDSGVQLGVISQRRWYTPCIRVKEAIEEGKIGKPVLGIVNMLGWRSREYYEADAWRGTWEMEGGGVLVNQAPHQLDLLLWYMGEIDEVFAVWKNLNHPFIEVEDTALAILKFKNGGIGNIIVSNSQKPGIYGKVHVHGENGASVGVQTDGGAMFIAGMSAILEPPLNDLWSVPGEEKFLEEWKREDSAFFSTIDPMVYYMKLQIADYLKAITSGTPPLVTGDDGRKVVELFTAIYRSSRDNAPVKFPLQPETNRSDFDGRQKYE